MESKKDLLNTIFDIPCLAMEQNIPVLAKKEVDSHSICGICEGEVHKLPATPIILDDEEKNNRTKPRFNQEYNDEKLGGEFFKRLPPS